MRVTSFARVDPSLDLVFRPGLSAKNPRCAARFAAVAAVAASLTAAAGPAWAEPSKLSPQLIYNYGEEETTRSSAMGGALRSLGAGTTALFLNPADLVETRVYHIEAEAQITPETGRQVYGGTIVDSMTGRLAGGISVMGSFMDPDGLNRSSLDVRLYMAYPLTEHLFVGIGGRYAKVTQNGPGDSFESSPGPFGPSDKVSGGLVDPTGGRYAFVNQLDFDAGITAKVTENLYFSMLGQNLAYAGNGLLPTMFGGGVGYATQEFAAEVDGLADFNSYASTTARISGGAEYLLIGHIPLRGGFKYDQGAKVATLSGGAGFIANEFSVEASLRRSLDSPGETGIVISLSYFLESSGIAKTVTPDF
jgi:hypothetical protein